MSSLRKTKKAKLVKKNLSNRLFLGGLSMFVIGLILFGLTFFPTFKEEVKYLLIDQKKALNSPIQPVNHDFAIVIPKIAANAAVIDNVDPFNSQQYQVALTKGVAHAKGTAYPGQKGNDFIFAHSSVNWYVANQYNSVFYLAHKLEKGDEIDLYFKNKKYVYTVSDKIIVDQSAVQYLNNNNGNTSVLTLMTCWPPGTSLKRLIIKAKISN